MVVPTWDQSFDNIGLVIQIFSGQICLHHQCGNIEEICSLLYIYMLYQSQSEEDA